MPGLLDRLLTPLGHVLRERRSGERHSVLRRPGWAGPATIAVTSASFVPGGVIDDRHSSMGRGGNRSPQLAWSGVPAGTAQLLLVLEDVDVPFDRPGLHTIGLLPPDLASVPEGGLARTAAGIRWVPTWGGLRTGYAGPRPLPGHGTHRYRFHILALDAAADTTARLRSIRDLDPFVAGHVLAVGTLEGTQDG